MISSLYDGDKYLWHKSMLFGLNQWLISRGEVLPTTRPYYPIPFYALSQTAFIHSTLKGLFYTHIKRKYSRKLFWQGCPQLAFPLRGDKQLSGWRLLFLSLLLCLSLSFHRASVLVFSYFVVFSGLAIAHISILSFLFWLAVSQEWNTVVHSFACLFYDCRPDLYLTFK